MIQLFVVRPFFLRSTTSSAMVARAFSTCPKITIRRNSFPDRKLLEVRRFGSSASQEGDGASGSSSVQDDPLAEYRNKNNIDDQVFSAMSKDGSVKVTACTARNLINDVMIMHTMNKTPADALGRTIVCALLMSNGMQEEQTVQL